MCVLFRRSSRLELTSWAYPAININSCLQALAKDISTAADIAPSALETIIFYCFMGYINALTYYLLLITWARRWINHLRLSVMHDQRDDRPTVTFPTAEMQQSHNERVSTLITRLSPPPVNSFTHSFLPRYAMLARYMLWPFVRLRLSVAVSVSVCHKSVSC